METQTLNYTCPKCGGTIQFEPGIQKIQCDFCRSVFDPEEFRPKEAVYAQEPPAVPATAAANWDYAGTPWHPGEQDGMVVYSCHSCGADIVAEETQGTAICLFCRKPIVASSRFSGSLRPDIIIPFKLRKEEAVAALQDHYLGKRLLPKVFKDKNHIDEVKGIYVPCWLFDAQANVQASYLADKNRTWEDSTYRNTEISHFRATRAGNLLFRSVPVDGSSSMDDALMESIEPFDVQAAVDFQGVYLTGYFASKYDVEMETCFARADERITQSALDTFERSLFEYNAVRLESQRVELKNRQTRYAMLPIWLLTTIWKDKQFVFAMNGQTGKLVGDLPIDKAARNRWFLGLFLGIGAAVSAIAALVWTIQGVWL